MKLKDKVSIVTGAGCGIGRGIAEVFARQGAKVVIAEINPETGQAVADGIVADGGEAIFIQCDVSSEEAVRKLVEKIIEGEFRTKKSFFLRIFTCYCYGGEGGKKRVVYQFS